VSFLSTHDKFHRLTGTIEQFHEGSDLVDILAEPDGKAIEVERTMTAHLDDVRAA
jgi:hypothetical protein